MSVDPQFQTHVRAAYDSLRESKLSLLRAAQMHDEVGLNVILRHAVQAVATAVEHLEDIQYVNRVDPAPCPTD